MRRVRSSSLDFPVELRLPVKENWHIVDGPTWLVAEHAPSSSQLALRTWRAGRLVRAAECEAAARLSRPAIPFIRDEAVVDRRAFAAPVGFETELVVGVEPGGRGLTGYALVIGSSVGRCYMAVFTTALTGGSAEQELATRLEFTVDRILSSVRVRSVDERAPRRRLISTPRSAAE